MYDLRNPATTRTRHRGFVVPSQDEWVKAAYFDPSGGGTLSYGSTDQPGCSGTGGTAPEPDRAPATRRATSSIAGDQPLASFHQSGVPAPSWCPAAQVPGGLLDHQPFGMGPRPTKAFVGGLGTVGQARTPSPWGRSTRAATRSVDGHHHPAALGTDQGRVWRLHGASPTPGVPDVALGHRAPAAGQRVLRADLPWLGIRVGVIRRPAG